MSSCRECKERQITQIKECKERQIIQHRRWLDMRVHKRDEDNEHMSEKYELRKVGSNLAKSTVVASKYANKLSLYEITIANL